MSRDDILDTQALRGEADGDPHIERQLLLLYITTAERCLALIQALVVHENRTEWVAATRELRLASLKIHAGQLLRLSAKASHTAHDAASRLRVYLEIKDAFEQFIRYLRRNNPLERAAGDS